MWLTETVGSTENCLSTDTASAPERHGGNGAVVIVPELDRRRCLIRRCAPNGIARERVGEGVAATAEWSPTIPER